MKKNANSVIASIVKKFMGNKSNEAVKEAIAFRDDVKRQVFSIIRNHPVSRELSNPVSPSRFLEGKRGTLFGFLGFKAGTNPVEQLIQLLDENWREEPKRQFTLTGFKVFIKLEYPTRTQMKAAGLVLGWQKSLAWPYAIESPISNLPYYLYSDKNGKRIITNASKSGQGIQVETAHYAASFSGVEYISEIMRMTRPLLRKKSFKIK